MHLCPLKEKTYSIVSIDIGRFRQLQHPEITKMDMQENPFGCGQGKKSFTMANILAKNVQSHHSKETESENKRNDDSMIAKGKPNTEMDVPTETEKEIEKQNSKRKPKRNLNLQVKKSKIQNSQNFMIETIFDRFPKLSDDIFEHLDEKSLANCVEVNRKWQTTIANQRVYLKKKFEKWTKYCKQSSHSG